MVQTSASILVTRLVKNLRCTETASMQAKIPTSFFLFWQIQLNLLNNGSGTVLRQYQHILKWDKRGNSKYFLSLKCILLFNCKFRRNVSELEQCKPISNKYLAFLLDWGEQKSRRMGRDNTLHVECNTYFLMYTL